MFAGGGVVRSDNGVWVSGFSVKLTANDAPEAELLALRFGIEFIQALEIDYLDVEIDAKEIMSLLTNMEDFSQHYLAPILNDVTKFLAENNHIQIMHTGRDSNKVAHGLTEFGIKMLCENAVHDTPPNEVKDVYEAELKGKQVSGVV